MIIKALSLKNFRIHRHSEIEFSDKLNYLVGGNGQGKTSVLEALYYICTTKNFKSAADSEFVTFGTDHYEINCSIDDVTSHSVRIFYKSDERKRYYLKDNKPVGKSSEIIGKFPIVLSTPLDHTLTQGYAADRRKFVDSVISQSSEVYLSLLLDYNKTLKQRAGLLYRIKETGRKSLIEELDAWDLKMVRSGAELVKFREKFISEFKTYISEAYQRIMGKDEEPSIDYDNFGRNSDDIERDFILGLKKYRNEEFRRCTNLFGPHKDDFIFGIQDKNLKIYGSQGQHKTFQTALRFAQFFYLKDKSGKSPVFLLDDIFGELDRNRASAISEYVKTVGQAFITVTDLSDLSFISGEDSDRVLKVSGGVVQRA